MFWFVLSCLGLGVGGYALYREGTRSTLRAMPAIARVGADIPEPVQRLVREIMERLTRGDASPADYRYEDLDATQKQLTFLFYTPFREENAAKLLFPSYRADRLIVKVRTAVINAEAKVGAGLPAHAQEQAQRLTEMLTRNDATPAAVRYKASTLFFYFYTPFRRNKALELLPPSYRVGDQIIYVQTALVESDATVGQVFGTAQETPWTCGPAALRAVLGHYGREVTEAELERAAVNAPAIGSRPEGLVRAAEVYGCRAQAFIMNGIEDLVELLARRIPPIVIVDSWTRPGQVGHYVVVSRIDLTRGLVTIMDPHTEGNWRVMTAKEFDERWWAKRADAKGEPLVIRRIAVVVVPGPGMAIVGAEASPVTPSAPAAHGRTAKMKYKGSWVDTLTSVSRKITSAAIATFGGKAAGMAFDALQDATLKEVKGLSGKDFVAWLNQASNEEVATLWLGELRYSLKQARDKKIKPALNFFAKLGLTDEAQLTGDRGRALVTALRIALVSYDNAIAKLVLEPFAATSKLLNVTVPKEGQLHKLQALAILLFGGPDVLPLLDIELQRQPKPKKATNDQGLTELLSWTDKVIDILHAYYDARAEAAEAQAKEAAEAAATATPPEG